MMSGKGRISKKEDLLVGYLFILPDTMGIFFFWILPMLYIIYLSFFRWNLLNEPVFVGLQNFYRLLKDPIWWHSLGITLRYVLLYVPLSFLFSLFLAVNLQKTFKGNKVLRTLFFAPYAISLIVAGALWSYAFQPKFGFINHLLTLLSLPPGGWLSSTKEALGVIVFVSLWKYVGYYMILLIAGLEEIPQEYYESAKIDGASWWHILVRITLPILSPVILFVIVISVIHAFQTFDLVYIMTYGGPARATYITMLYIYEVAFSFYDFGYASTLSITFFLLILLITLAQFRLGLFKKPS